MDDDTADDATQPPMPEARLDNQLARRGLVDDAEPTAEPTVQPATPPVATDAEFERLREEFVRLREELDGSMRLVRLLMGVMVILAVVVVVLLVR